MASISGPQSGPFGRVSRRLPLTGALTFGLVAALSVCGGANAAEVYLGDGRGGTVASDPSRMLDVARVRSEIPVIVEMDTEFVPEGELSLFAAANQRAAIAGAQTRVLDRVSGARNVKTFRSVPMMAMMVGANELAALLDDRSVTAVYEDVAVPPALAESVPLIRADVAADVKRIKGGKGWAVAVLDTGVQRNHKALKGKIVAEGCFSTSNAASKSVCPGGEASSTAKGSGANCNPSIEGCDHGTHVAGIAVGSPKGKYKAYKGVAPKADLIPMQVFSKFSSVDYCGGPGTCALSYTSDQLAALEEVNDLASRHKIAAVNMSLGGGLERKACNKNPLKKIVKTLRSKRIAVAIAAGNDGVDGRVASPGCVGPAVTVASTTKTDEVSGFSNFSKLVDLAAPGSAIVSSVPKNKFKAFSGTSMAAPHVAGAWALLRHRFPKTSVTKIEKALKCSGIPVMRAGVTKKRIDVYGAYLALKNGCP
jgi:subtilisin